MDHEFTRKKTIVHIITGIIAFAYLATEVYFSYKACHDYTQYLQWRSFIKDNLDRTTKMNTVMFFILASGLLTAGLTLFFILRKDHP